MTEPSPQAPDAPPRDGAWSKTWTLADQGAVSLGNFCTNMLLIRSLAEAEYGAFGLVYGVLLFLNNLHASLITYPLTVKGAASDDHQLRRLAGVSAVLTLALAVPLSGVAVGAAGAVGRWSLAPWVILALLMWQLQETMRRGLMAHLRYRDAFWGDALSYLGQAAVVWALTRHGPPALHVVFAWIAATSAAAAALQAVQLRLSHEAAPQAVSVAWSYWDLGRWMTLGNLVNVVNVQLVPWTLRVFHGLAEAAKLQALGQVLAVTHPLIFSLNNLVVPATARVNKSAGRAAALRVAGRYALLGAAVVVPFYLLVAAFPGPVLRLYYGRSSPYLPLHTPMRLFAVAYAIIYASNMLGAVLNGLEKTRSAFAAQMLSVAVTLALTLPLAAWGGVTFGLVGGCVSVTAGAAAAAWLLYRYAGRGNVVEESAVNAQPAAAS